VCAAAIANAATANELDAALAGIAHAGHVSPARRPRWLICVFGGAEHRGLWRLSDRLRVISVFGGINVDLGAAQLEAPESVITVIALFGGAGIIAPPGVAVQLSGLSLFAGKGDKRQRGPALPGSPLIRVRALVLFGGVTIKNRRAWTWRSLVDRIKRRDSQTERT